MPFAGRATARARATPVVEKDESLDAARLHRRRALGAVARRRESGGGAPALVACRGGRRMRAGGPAGRRARRRAARQGADRRHAVFVRARRGGRRDEGARLPGRGPAARDAPAPREERPGPYRACASPGCRLHRRLYRGGRPGRRLGSAALAERAGAWPLALGQAAHGEGGRWISSSGAAEWRACPRTSAVTPSARPASRCVRTPAAISKPRQSAGHANIKTTQLYNRSGDRKRKAEVERVQV